MGVRTTGVKQRWSQALAANPRETGPPRPIGWGQAMVVMAMLVGVLWLVEIANLVDHYGLNRFGLRPRELAGLWGILTMPFLHVSAMHLLANTGPFLLIGWVVMIGGIRLFATVTALIMVLGGLLTWAVAPTGLVVGASALVFGWLGYLIARAVFSRRFSWIVVAVTVSVLFAGLFGNLLPQMDAGAGMSLVSWQAHLAGFVAGLVAGWLWHPRHAKAPALRFRAPPHV